MSADREPERENQSNDSDNSDMEKNMPINPPENNSNSNGPSPTRGKEKCVISSSDETDDDTAEREKRKKINDLFGSLQAMLPHVPSQADKITVVDETLNYITTLEKTLENLQKTKMQRLLRSSVSNVGHPSVCSSKKWRLFTTICYVLEKYKIEVLFAHITCDNNGRRFYMFEAQVNRDSDQLPGALSAEETFKQAAEEIILCLALLI
ncbi:transcription factor bHLH95-like [Prosopis cineraria]|uniref:transcription factor bHLH95-like n=1 Tax=Prosopis cineraria TaxID=364024 RepID=UPI0024100C8E|nr:transcription factor bHLH95-like [Prosopis cineraria]